MPPGAIFLVFFLSGLDCLSNSASMLSARTVGEMGSLRFLSWEAALSMSLGSTYTVLSSPPFDRVPGASPNPPDMLLEASKKASESSPFNSKNASGFPP